MTVVAVVAKRQDLPMGRARPAAPIALRIVAAALLALALPPLVLGGILGGLFTPTEAAVVAAAYAVVLGTLWYRELALGDLPGILWESCRQTAQVMFIITAAAPFGWVLIQQQIPNAVLNTMLGVSREPWVVLLIINAALLVLGMFIEGIAILIIAFPVLLPIVTAIGVDPVHFGVIIVLNLMIGLVTPPIGLCLYVVSSVSKVSMTEISAEIWPYLLALLVVLGVITFVPALSLWLPNALGYGVVR
jgi:tripartite ATP-independent transporter DctM subunit